MAPISISYSYDIFYSMMSERVHWYCTTVNGCSTKGNDERIEPN